MRYICFILKPISLRRYYPNRFKGFEAKLRLSRLHSTPDIYAVREYYITKDPVCQAPISEKVITAIIKTATHMRNTGFVKDLIILVKVLPFLLVRKSTSSALP